MNLRLLWADRGSQSGSKSARALKRIYPAPLSQKDGAGFTILELIVILAITPILAVLALNTFNDYQANYQLLLTAEEMRSALTEAHVLAMIGEGGARHGIAVTAANGTYTLFRGPSYARRDPSFDRDYQWEYQYITYSGPQEVVFSRLKGTTTPASITLTNTAQKQRTITINEVGTIQ